MFLFEYLLRRRKRIRKGKIAENRIARNYARAGYKVKLRKITKAGEIDVIAWKRGRKFVIESKHSIKGRKITTKDVRILIKKAKQERGKPVLYLSGKAELTSNAKRIAREEGVRVRRNN